MKTSLQLSQSQKLAMSQQMQQSIKLLQLSSLELQQEIQHMLESNPLLDVIDDIQEDSDTEEKELLNDSESLDLDKDIHEELDSNWDESLSADYNQQGSSNVYEFDESYSGVTSYGLYEHLCWQRDLTPFTDIDRTIATSLIEALDESGYLTISLDDILLTIGDNDVTLKDVEIVLKRLQHFDPIGAFSRNLQESLLLQLTHINADHDILNLTKTIIRDDLDKLANKEYKSLIKKYNLDDDVFKQAVSLIQSLNPRPGNYLQKIEDDYIIPDILMVKKYGKWAVELNTQNIPKFGINSYYASMVKSVKDEDDSLFFRNNLQNAKWFIKCIEQRNSTLYDVASYIVEYQQDFFTLGPKALKPLILNDVALKTNLHFSTISRVTTQKYIQTPLGLFELKYFFSSSIGNSSSSTAIHAKIKELIANENKQKPLSDSKIAVILNEQGIDIARRTVAKYRESLDIATSSLRKLV